MPDELTPKQNKALAALIESPTLEAAANSSGISTVTMWRHLNDETFSAAYRSARREIVSHAVVQLQRACGEAVQTLRDVATDGSAQPGARVSAAKAILDTAIKAVELDDFATRIEKLEREKL